MYFQTWQSAKNHGSQNKTKDFSTLNDSLGYEVKMSVSIGDKIEVSEAAGAI